MKKLLGLLSIGIMGLSCLQLATVEALKTSRRGNKNMQAIASIDADDEEWTTWADAFNQGENKEVYLLTNGDRKNEFFTPSFVVEHNVTGLKLERNPSMTTVLEADVETTVVLVVKDKFGHTHEIKALTFTMKKDAK